MHVIKQFVKNYFNFTGIMSRKSYWLFILLCVVLSFAVQMLDKKLGTHQVHLFRQYYYLTHLLFVVSFITPIISATVRRLHDAGFSGCWSLLFFVPKIGKLALFVMLVWKREIAESSKEGSENGERPSTAELES